jgi:hypothetical protein
LTSNSIGYQGLDSVLEKAKGAGRGSSYILSDDEFTVLSSEISIASFSNRDIAVSRKYFQVSSLIMTYLDNKYNVTRSDFHEIISNANDRYTYATALSIYDSYLHREYDICFDNDEEKKKGRNKINEISRSMREQLGAKAISDKSDAKVGYLKQMRAECRFSADYGLLSIYQSREKYNSYNKLFLEIIKDDQVMFDYLYKGSMFTDVYFTEKYFDFFCSVNSYDDANRFTKDDISLLYEAIQSKHKDVFYFNTYYNSESILNEYSADMMVRCLLHFTIWLDHHGTPQQKINFINTFFKQKEMPGYLKYFESFDNYRTCVESINEVLSAGQEHN